jgi:predicted benzoate:H+ symporter BenE
MKSKIINWIKGLLNDEKGNPSSKRIMGLVAGFSLCITMITTSFTDISVAPPTPLINAVAALAFGALGLTSIDKIWSNKKDQDQE